MEPDQGSGTGRESGHEPGNKQSARRNGVIHPTPRSRLSVAELRQLIRLMTTSDIAEITLEHEAGGLHVTLRKPAPVVAAPMAVTSGASPLGETEIETGMEAGAESEELAAREPASENEKAFVEVRSPLVGVFRNSMKEHGKPLVSMNETVRQGQVVAAIEALNVLNEVEVPTAGCIKQVLVSDGQPVEYGQPLLLIEPKVTL